MPGAVLLDRDGVINRDRARSVRSVSEFELLPHVPEAVRLLNEHGYQVVVVTNQACIGRGDLSRAELERIHQAMRAQIEEGGGHVADVYVCAHTDEDACACRKPRPGLILQAERDHAIDLPATWFVGDDLRDVEAAQAAGCKPAFVHTGKKVDTTLYPDVPVFDNLLDFAAKITHQDTDG